LNNPVHNHFGPKLTSATRSQAELFHDKVSGPQWRFRHDNSIHWLNHSAILEHVYSRFRDSGGTSRGDNVRVDTVLAEPGAAIDKGDTDALNDRWLGPRIISTHGITCGHRHKPFLNKGLETFQFSEGHQGALSNDSCHRGILLAIHRRQPEFFGIQNINRLADRASAHFGGFW
jgi:hypothetical protein